MVQAVPAYYGTGGAYLLWYRRCLLTTPQVAHLPAAYYGTDGPYSLWYRYRWCTSYLGGPYSLWRRCDTFTYYGNHLLGRRQARAGRLNVRRPGARLGYTRGPTTALSRRGAQGHRSGALAITRLLKGRPSPHLRHGLLGGQGCAVRASMGAALGL